MKEIVLLLFIAISLCANAQQIRNHSFRAFVDGSYKLGIVDQSINRAQINVTLGYQINQNLFLGVGSGLTFDGNYNIDGSKNTEYFRESKNDVPIYADARFDWAKGKIQPYFELRAGKYVNHSGGAYVDMAVGLRFPINDVVAINLALAHEYEDLQYAKDIEFENTSGTGLALRVGVEF